VPGRRIVYSSEMTVDKSQLLTITTYVIKSSNDDTGTKSTPMCSNFHNANSPICYAFVCLRQLMAYSIFMHSNLHANVMR